MGNAKAQTRLAEYTTIALTIPKNSLTLNRKVHLIGSAREGTDDLALLTGKIAPIINENWMILAEGAKTSHADPVVQYLHTLGQQYNIRVTDPVPNLDSHLTRASIKRYISKKGGWTNNALFDYGRAWQIARDLGIQPANRSELIESIVNNSGLSRKRIENAFRTVASKLSCEEEPIYAIEQANRLSQYMGRRIIDSITSKIIHHPSIEAALLHLSIHNYRALRDWTLDHNATVHKVLVTPLDKVLATRN